MEKIEMYTYEEYCVMEVLKELSNDVDISAPYSVDGFALPPDLYAPKGIPSLGLTGETVIEVKKHLSYAGVKNLKEFYETHGKNYNVLVVYFEKSITNFREKDESQGKKLRYISFNELKSLRKSKKSIKKASDFYRSKSNKDWRANVAFDELAKLHGRLSYRTSSTYGIFLSRTGFTASAVEMMYMMHPHNILLWSFNEIDECFKNHKFLEALKYKYQYAMVTADPMIAVYDGFNI